MSMAACRRRFGGLFELSYHRLLGDAVPQTTPGRIIAGIVMICGLGVFGLSTGILATGFAAERRRRDFIQNGTW